MIYKVEWSEVKKEGNTNGRAWKITEMTLKDEQGVITEKVSTFDSVMTGAEIEGSVVKNDKGYLTFKKLEAPNFVKENRSAFKQKVIDETMQRKEQSIGKFQDSKEWSIKVSSTMRDAVLLAIAEQNPTKENVLKWREWLWNNFDVETDQFPPFN